ncbi:MAG TPA: EamA family transporter [Methylomirabilota bacterium]|nr:EamA family transporter [Methylomirabilota bacterium]
MRSRSGSIGAMALYYYLLARGTAGRVAANFYLVPGTVALAAWALLGERLTPLAVVGFAIASAGVSWWPAPRAARAPAPAQDGRMTALPVVWVSKSL